MRKIKFRGKRVDNDEWVYGSFIPDALESTHHSMVSWAFIKTFDSKKMKGVTYEVERETVGRYINFKDANDVDIYDGDVVRCYGGELFGGYWERDCVVIVKDYMSIFTISESEFIEIIGNIHDNPELSEVAE